MNNQTNNSILAKQHSRLGIASIIIGISVPFVLILFFVIAMLLGTEKGSLGNSVLIGGFVFAISAPIFHLVGIIFGVVGWVSKKTKNLFPIIGTILNSLLGLIGVLLITLAMFQLIKLGGLILH